VASGEVVYHVKTGAAEVERILLTDEVASKANILTKDASTLLGSEGTYIRVLGTEEQLKRVETLLEGKARRIEGDELQEVLRKLKEEDERALAGFGSIFS
jgi:predicted nucleotidyltransferase